MSCWMFLDETNILLDQIVNPDKTKHPELI